MERRGFSPHPDVESSKKQKAISKVANLYFEPKPWEREGLYEGVGIRYFQRLLKLLPFYRMSRGDKSEIEKLLNLGKVSETVHGTAFGVLTLSGALSFKRGDWEDAVLLVAVNVTTQLYPLMSQRYNRIRLNRIRTRLQERKPHA